MHIHLQMPIFLSSYHRIRCFKLSDIDAFCTVICLYFQFSGEAYKHNHFLIDSKLKSAFEISFTNKKIKKKINKSLLCRKQGGIYSSPFLPIYDIDFPDGFEITTLRNKILQHLLCYKCMVLME